MAKIKVTGNIATIISDLSLETIRLAKKRRPDSTILFSGEGENRRKTFIVTVDGDQCVSRSGIGFLSENGGHAFVNITVETPEDEILKSVKEQLGGVVLNLSKVEKQINDILEDIEAEDAEIDACIEYETL